MEKYNVEQTKKSAYKERGEPSEWRILESVVKIAWRESSRGSGNTESNEAKVCRKAKQKGKR